jgi:predicted TPR repeat methyltransferase
MKKVNLPSLIKEAEKKYSSGKYKKSIELYKEALKIAPQRVATYIDCGNAFDADGDKKAAAEHYKKAIGLDENNITAISNLSGTLYELEDYEQSLQMCNRALEINPKYVMAIVNKANILDVTGSPKEAIKLYDRAIKIKPDYAIAYSNKGSVLYELDRYKEAIKACKKAVELNPQDANGYINLGNAYDMLEMGNEAIEAYVKAVDIEPHNITGFNNLGSTYEKLEMFEEAMNCYWQTIVSDENYTNGHLNFGYLLYELESRNLKDKAIAYAKKWVEKFPDNSIAIHMSAAVDAIEAPKRAADDYVVDLFDEFAPDFDESLKAIEYKAPQLLEGAVLEHLGRGDGQRAVLDAGCGTGLCAKALRPYAKQGAFVGVDLSKGMLKEAEKRKLYDNLVEAELTGFLHGNNDGYDLIVSSDVLTYFGDLQAVFAGFFNALKKGGTLGFTITHCRKECPKGYDLHASGRYSHTKEYVVNTLKDLGFDVKKISKCELRKENGYPVWGLLVIADK